MTPQEPPKPNPVKPYDFQFTERDGAILAAVARYRFLQTGQIRRLIFGTNQSAQPARRRLRYLVQGKYLRKIQPPLTGAGKTESVFLLDRPGRAYVAHAGFETPRYGAFKATSLPFLTHAVALSEFRVTLELALRDHPVVQLNRFISDFELKTGQKGLRGQHRYRLFATLEDPRSGAQVVFYPDAVMILAGRNAHADRKRLFFVEIDRGTENLTVLRQKLRGYELAAEGRVHSKFGVTSAFRLLVQVPSASRRDSLLKAFSDHPLAREVWVSIASDLTPADLLSSPLWTDLTGQARSILKTPRQD